MAIISAPEEYNINTSNSWNSELDGNIQNYYYFTPEELDKKLDLKDQELTVIINFKTRNVISKKGVNEDGKPYYRQYDLQTGGEELKN